MTLHEVDRKVIKCISRSYKGKLLIVQEMFLHSNLDAVEVEWKDDYSTAYRCYSSLSGSIKKHEYRDQIRCVKNGQHIYLLRIQE